MVPPKIEMFKCFESYPKTVRLVARALRWRNCATRKFIHLCIDAEEYKLTENFIFKAVQRLHFPENYTALQATGRPHCNCNFLDINPQYDSHCELIVCGDRLMFSDLPETTKETIILPARDHLVRKLILHVYYTNSHAPQDTTFAVVRERFHIIHIREEVRKALKECKICRHFASKPLQQEMGVLPEERVTPAFAFTDIGLDFTGPVHIKNVETGRMRKSYICIFTCTHSRMVHFQLANNMSTEEFLCA